MILLSPDHEYEFLMLLNPTKDTQPWTLLIGLPSYFLSLCHMSDDSYVFHFMKTRSGCYMYDYYFASHSWCFNVMEYVFCLASCSLRWNHLVDLKLLLSNSILERSSWNLKMKKESYRLMIIFSSSAHLFKILLLPFYFFGSSLMLENIKHFSKRTCLVILMGQTHKLPDAHLQKLKSLEAQGKFCRTSAIWNLNVILYPSCSFMCMNSVL